MDELSKVIQDVADYCDLQVQPFDERRIELVFRDDPWIHIQMRLNGDLIQLFLMERSTLLGRTNDAIVDLTRHDWEANLTTKIYLWVGLYNKLKPCRCGNTMKIYRENNRLNPNYGRYYGRCDRHQRQGDGHQLIWLTEKVTV